MVHKRLEEYLCHNWPPVPFNAKCKKQGNPDLEGGKKVAVGETAPAAGSWDKVVCKRDSTVGSTKVAIDAAIEVTGVSAELAANAVNVSKVYR